MAPARAGNAGPDDGLSGDAEPHAWVSPGYAAARPLYAAYRQVTETPRKILYAHVAAAHHADGTAWTSWQLFDLGGLNDFIAIPACLGRIPVMNRLALALALTFAGCVSPPERGDTFGGLDVHYEAARPALGGALGADKLPDQIAAVFRIHINSNG